MKTLTTWEWLGLPPTYKDSEDDALASISYLWGDDCLWGDQVDKLWNDFKQCLENPSNDELKKYETYFKRGEKADYITESYQFFLTPIKTPLDARVLLGAKFFTATTRNNLLANYIFKMELFRSLDWYEGHMKKFIQAFYSSEYVLLEEKPAKKVKKVSPNPGFWCDRYVRQALSALTNNDSYAPCYDCISYFLSILPHANDASYRKYVKMTELLAWIDSSLDADNQLSGNAAAFLENLNAVKDEIVTAWKQGEVSNG